MEISKLNRYDYTFVNNMGTLCSNKFDVESPTALGVGFIYGLKVQDESTQSFLTMSRDTQECGKGPRTLGLGDWNGIWQKYPE